MGRKRQTMQVAPKALVCIACERREHGECLNVARVAAGIRPACPCQNAAHERKEV